MQDPELRVQLDLAAADDSWVVYVARKSGDRIRVFRKSHKFPVADLPILRDDISSDIQNEILTFEARHGVEEQTVG